MNTKCGYTNQSLMKLSKHAVRAAVVLLLLLPVAARAGGVVTNCTEAALRAAMTGGGVVTFACDGTIALSSPLDISTYTVLDATNRKVTISGNSACRVFLVNSNVNFTVLNLAIANGRSDNGAGIYNAGGYLTVQNCVFVGNTAIGQAGVSGSPGTNGSGGALFNAGFATIVDSTFSTNGAVGGAGGTGTNAASFNGGSGGPGGLGYGGAVYNLGEVTLANCTLNGNTAVGGAGGTGGDGAWSNGGDGGPGGAGGSGCGGAFFNGGSARLANTTLTGNVSTGSTGGAGGNGGGEPAMYGGDGGNGNAGGSGLGGGIYDLTGHCSLTNCTLALNWVMPGQGGAGGLGGFATYGSGSPGLPGSAGSASGGGISSSGGAFLINVLLGSNAPANGSGSIIDGGHNLSSDNSCGFTNVGSLNNTNPLVGPLTDNGGPTLTMALMPGSPAIDAGDDRAAPPVDQRGVQRPVGLASDIGAYESGPPGIIAAPPSQSVALGSTVDFSAAVAGYPPLSYQWSFNGTNVIAGATNSVLHLVSVQPSQSGVYTLVLSNTFGAVTSPPAQLDVVFRTVTRCTEAILRLAMAGGGTVTFACDGTILLANTITNLVDTVLDGSGHQVTISGGDSVRVFCVPTNVSFGVINLTIAHGLDRVGGGILNLGGKVSLDGVQVQANTASYEVEPQFADSAAGGGIFNLGGSVAATNCVFSGNKALEQTASSSSPSRTRGGALCNQSGEISLRSCSFYSNSAVGAPGLYNTGGTAHEASGGAIANSGTLAADFCTFFANSAAGGVGGSGGGDGGDGNGGAVCNLGMLELSDSMFLSNSVSGGLGGMGYEPGPTWPVAQNGGPGGLGGGGNGGGLFNAGVSTIVSCTFAGNIARGGTGGPGGAGGLSLSPPDHPSRGGDGGSGGGGGSACGAICDLNALCLLTNCTVSSNFTIQGAGGPGGPGGFGTPGGSPGPTGPDGQATGSLRSVGAVIMNTVLSGNAPGGNCSGTFTDGGQNISSDCSCAFTNNTPPKTGASVLPPYYLLHNFTGQEVNNVDAHPYGPLVASSDDTFCGVTTGSAYPGAGAVFKVSRNATDSSFTVLWGFEGSSTYGPAGALALSDDVLYGTTVGGGQANKGTVYTINMDGSGYGILHSFTGAGDGTMPNAGLVLSGSTLYGTTSFGGSSDYGTIFRIETNGSGYSIMHDFQGGTNGAGPAAELVLSGSTLYGTTWGGGYSSGSTVFKINTDGSGFAVLKHFDAATSGAHPFAALAISGATLFGTTGSRCYDGNLGCGSVFKINTDGSGFSILKQFPGSDGPDFHAGLIFSGGILYGTTSGDGSPTNCGTLFMINADGSGYTLLRQFNSMDGAGPNGNLLLLGNTLYGTTENGGFYGNGVAFALSLSPPGIISLPPSQTAEIGGNVEFTVEATGFPTPSCQWFFNATNPVPGATRLSLDLGAVQFSQSGAYTIVLTSSLGAITSAPVLLNVVAPVERKLVQGLRLTGEPGSLLNVDYANTLSPSPNWSALASVSLTNTWQYWFDDTVPLPPVRFYRARQTGTPSVRPSLSLDPVPAITLTGSIGHSVRVDYINRFGPIDAWVTLDTVTLTNTSQLYFDVSAPGQPQRLYRLVPLP